MILLPNCTCCGCSEECCRTRTYSYEDTEPPGKWYDECPNIGNCADGEDAVVGDCADDVIEGYIVERFCKQSIAGKEIHAFLRENSKIDDYGTIAGIDTIEECGILGIIEADHDITSELEFEDDGAYLIAKVPFRAENSQLGGPVGAAGVVICWCCVDPQEPPPEGGVCPCCAGPPPPPPPSCCSKLDTCEDGTLIKRCGKYVPSQCCSSHQEDSESAVEICGGESPPVISCEENGHFPAANAPHDCLNSEFQGGAWVTVSDWSTFDPAETDPDLIALYAEVDSKVNQSFFVPFTCLGAATKTFDLGVGAGADRTTAGTRCNDANWFAEVSVNLCARTASVTVSNDSCWSATAVGINLSDLTAIGVPCNSWTGCICEGFSGENEGFGGGEVAVSASA
jgi:hypothetical protein